MLDTIRVKFPIYPTDEHLTGWITKITQTQTGERKSYIYNPKVNDTTLRFTYYPVDYSGKPMLTLECSLPKLVFGNNFQMLGSLEEAIEKANKTLENLTHLPVLDLAQGVLIRLDMCYNHQVGDMVDDYINALGKLEYPHRRTKYHRNEGAEFKAKHKTTKFYNKEFESGYQEAHGILRQETTMLNGKDIKIFLLKSNPTLLDISREQVIAELNSDLEKLGLLNRSIGNQNTALKRLCDEYGEMAGFYYHSLLINKMDKSKKRIAQETKLHPRSLDRRLRKIIDADLPLTITDREEPLPPLEIKL